MYTSTWQAHKAKDCGGCWYCKQYTPIGMYRIFISKLFKGANRKTRRQYGEKA